jgi:hypothetical protein
MAREVQRSVLPIPDQPSFGLVTYDARDPDTKFPPIEPLRPPEGAPNVLVILLDDIGFRGGERVRRPVQHAHRGEAGRRRAEVHTVPFDGVVRTVPQGAADWP